METFDPEKPLGQLPTRISNIYVKEAKKMLDELENNRLEVTLYDAPRKRYPGHKIRVAENHPPDWYRDIFHKNELNYRRDRTTRALERIMMRNDPPFQEDNTSSAVPCRFKYVSDMRRIIHRRLTKKWEPVYNQMEFCYPVKEAVDYFNIPTEKHCVERPERFRTFYSDDMEEFNSLNQENYHSLNKDFILKGNS
ncbi:MAG: hypothetical protein ABEK36_04845 [Candidatus Aenigmatarchaeota archaeon]